VFLAVVLRSVLLLSCTMRRIWVLSAYLAAVLHLADVSSSFCKRCMSQVPARRG